MADVNANIGVNIDTSNALSQLKNLQRQISQFHQSVAKSSSAAASAQRDLQKNFVNSVNAIQGFSAELRTVKSTAESFTNSLEKNKFSVREYFRYAAGATKTFGKSFQSEFSTIEKTAIERVKTLQTQYIKMGRDASGAMQAIAIRPAVLNMEDLGTKTAIAAQKQVLFNQLVKQGSTNLLNFGKNTQWAGRQLMVGFTIPLMVFGSMASKTFMTLEEEMIKFKKVYGDLLTNEEETNKALEQITSLADGFTKYGVSVAETVRIAATAAAAGFNGLDLQRQTEQSLRLSILGQLEQQKALETTISLQNAFRLSSEELADAINFLNAVENQSVVALDDITTAIPKVAPVIQALGGNVKDLAFFIAAMKESGVNASEGANALKSSLGRLVNPTKAASDFMQTLGINIRGIVDRNAGDLQGMIFEVGAALDKLDPLNRSRAIERLFGKFQFARMSALFDNINREGSQAARVLDLSQASAEDLARAAEEELGISAASSMNKFRGAIEQLQKSLAPIGELFLQIATPFVEFGTKVLDAFNDMPDGVKKTIGTLITVLGGIAPILLMTFGLINNGIANMIKFFATARLGYLKLTGQAQGIGEETQYMTQEQLEAAAAAASLDQAHSNLTQRFTAETTAVMQLKAAYEQAAAAGARFAMLNPGMMKPGAPAKFASGGAVGGSGNGDTVPAMLTPGEFVINKEAAQKMLPFLEALNSGKLPGFNSGGLVGKGFSNATMFLPESINTVMGGSGQGAAAGDVTAYLKQAADAAMAPLMAVMAREMGIKLNDPALFDEWQGLGNSLVDNAIEALEQSGKQFLTDDDFEELVIPAMKKAAENVTVAGKEVKSALDNAFEQIRTVGPVGADSGALGGSGRVSLPGSYRSARVPAQTFAMQSNPEMFQQTDRFSQSRQRIVKSFQTKNIATDEFEVATMSHLKRSISTSVDNLIAEVAPYLGDQSERIIKAVSKNTVDGIKKATDQASPSKEAYESGRNIGVGAINGLNEQSDEAMVAGESLGQKIVSSAGATQSGNMSRGGASFGNINAQSAPAVQDSMREISNAEVFVAKKTARIISSVTEQWNAGTREIPKIIKDGIESKNKEFKIVGGGIAEEIARASMERAKSLSSANVSVAAPGDEGFVGPLTKEMTNATNKVSNFSGNLSNAAMGLSAVTGVLSVFGADLNGIMPAISGVSAGLFALIQISQLLSKTQMAQVVTGRALAAAQLMGSKSVADLFVKGAGLGGVLTNVASGFKFVMNFLGPIGIGLGVLSVALPLLGAVIQEQKDKIEGLGNVAFLTAEKMKLAGELLGFTPREVDFAAAFSPPEGVSAQEATSAKALSSDQKFLDGFEKEITAVASATLDEAQAALESLAIRLATAGADETQIATMLTAITQAANRTDISLKIATSIDIATPEGQAMIAKTGQKAADILNQALAENPITSQGDITDTLMKSVKQAAGTYATLFGAMKTGLVEGTISAEVFNQQMAQISSQLSEVDPTVFRAMIPQISEALGLDEVFLALNTTEDQLLAIQAATAGFKVEPTDLVALSQARGNADEETMQKAIDIRAKFKTAIEENAEVVEKERLAIEAAAAAKAKADKATLDLSAKEAEIQKNQETIELSERLVEAGLNEADAMKIATDEVWANIFAEAERIDLLEGNTDATQKAITAYNNLKESTEGLTDAQNKANYAKWKTGIEEQNDALNKLEAAGVPTATAIKIINDEAARTAALAAMGEGSFDKWLEDYNKIQAIAARVSGSGGGGSQQKSAFQEAMDSLKKQREEIKNNIKAYAGLRKAGFSVAEAAKLAADSQLAAALASKKVGSKEWQQLVKQIRLAAKEALKTPDGIRNAFGQLKSQADQYYDILERVANRKYADQIRAQEKAITDLSRAMEKVNDEIDVYQKQIETIQRSIELDFDRPIQALQKESGILANDLILMDKAAEEITEKYDDQAKALEQVAKVNQQILNQKKSQVSLADALSQGDISAAASIMQDMRAANAEAARTSQSDMLNTAKQAELDAQRSASGMSRLEIEKRQFEISQQVFNLEQQREVKSMQVRDIEDQIYTIRKDQLEPLEAQALTAERNLRTTKDLLQAELDAIDAQRGKFDDAELALERASIKGGKFRDVLKAAKKITGDVVSDWQKLNNKTITITTRYVYETAGGNTKAKNTGGMIFRNLGGDVPGRGNTDTIPAMLTPGEYVVNKRATSKYRPLLKAINAGTFGANLDPGRYSIAPKMSIPKDFNSPVYAMPDRAYPQYGDSGISYATSSRINVPTSIDNSVYNYSLNVSVDGANASANDIANVVINKIRNLQSQQVRRQAIR